MFSNPLKGCSCCNPSGPVFGEPIDAGADIGKRDGPSIELSSQIETRPVTACERVIVQGLLGVAPDWSHGVNDPGRRQISCRRSNCRTWSTHTYLCDERLAFLQYFRPARGVNSAVYPATPCEVGIGSINDHIDADSGDVALLYRQHRSAGSDHVTTKPLYPLAATSAHFSA